MSDEPQAEPEDDSAEQEAERKALEAEIFQTMGRIADAMGDVEPLRQALMKSFSVVADPKMREQYDDLRLQVDAFLRARAGGEAKVERPEGFIESPEVDAASLHAAFAALAEDDDQDHER